MYLGAATQLSTDVERAGANSPCSHGVHSVEPELLEYVDGGQGSHGVDAFES